MTWLWFVATVCVTTLLRTGPVQSSSGLSSSLFTNELRSGYSRLFQNGVEQPVSSPYGQLQRNPVTEFLAGNPLLQQQRPSAAFGGPLSPTFQFSRPRFNPSWGGKSKPNDVLVVVVKTRSNCSANGTEAEGDDDSDEDVDDEGPNPDDDVEEVTIVVGGVEKGKEPSRCVWAILACCAPANTPIRFSCFDMLGCSTAFWDTNPCLPAIVQTALDQAIKYYGPATNTTTTTTTTTTTPAPPDGASSGTTVAAATTPIADASTAASAPAA